MAIEIPDIKEFVQAVKPKPVGFKTLFVNSRETQKLAYKYGIPLVTKLERHNNFQNTSPRPPTDLTNEDVINSDLLRYNLGKFYFGNNKTYQFVNNKNIETNADLLPSADNPPASPKQYASPLTYMIGQPASAEYITPGVEYQFIKTKFDLQSLEFGSETFIILQLKPGYIFDTLEKLYPNFSSSDLFKQYLASGKNIALDSPQYLGLGNVAVGVPDADGYLPVGDFNGGSEFIYNDHAFIYNHPYNQNQGDNLEQIKVLYFDLKSDYNFYQTEYEKALFNLPGQITFGTAGAQIQIPIELYLPNFLTIVEESKTAVNEDEIENQQFNKNPSYAIHSTLGGRIPINTLRPLKESSKDYEEILGSYGNQYLDTWSKTFKPQTQPNIFQDLSVRAAINKYRNIIYSPDVLKNEDLNVTKKSFPFYNEINFNTDTTNQIADMLKNSKLFDALILDYIHKTLTKEEGYAEIDFHPYQELISYDFLNSTIMSENPDAKTEVEFSLTKQGTKLKTYDFDLFAQKIKNLTTDSNLINDINDIQLITISAGGEDFSDNELDIFQNDPLTQLIYKMTFLSNYGAFVKNNIRNYKEIIQGKNAYSETLFYRIEKKDGAGNIIQNFYVLNDSELDEVSLIDTQIKYGKNYTYQIYAVQLVLGNEYFYKKGPVGENTTYVVGANPDPSNPYQKDIDVDENFNTTTMLNFNLIADTKQSVKLIELPYTTSKNVRLQEAPPVPPDINFIPYRNVDNKVLITFNVGIGEYYDSYIPILDADDDLIQDSSIVNENGQVLFKSEGDVTSYDMFRISSVRMPEGPTSYSDFGTQGNAKSIRLHRRFGEPTFVDNLLPNTKYWYTFRSNDKKHAGTTTSVDFSNPTDVYQIELVNSDGVIYLVMETYDISFFNQQKLLLEKTKTKTMRKYLHLKPNFEQTILNTDPDLGIDYTNPAMVESTKKYVEEDLNEDVSKFKLGYKKESVFGNTDDDTNNKFKVRLISKKTGRKLDILLRFKKPILEK